MRAEIAGSFETAAELRRHVEGAQRRTARRPSPMTQVAMWASASPELTSLDSWTVA